MDGFVRQAEEMTAAGIHASNLAVMESHQAVAAIATNGRRHVSRFRLTEFNIYPTFSYLADQSATYNEFEFASHTDLGFLEMENRTVLNVADLPSTIKLGPTNPGDLPTTIGVRGNGFGDILSGFFFSLPGATNGRRTWGWDPS